MDLAPFNSSIEFHPDSVYLFSESMAFEGGRSRIVALSQFIEVVEMLDNGSQITVTKRVFTRQQRDCTVLLFYLPRYFTASRTDKFYSIEREISERCLPTE